MVLKIQNDIRDLVKYVYILTNKFPKDELYSLTNQTRRSIVSVSLNVREGNEFREAKRINFFKIAIGSLCEVDECLILAKRFDYILESDLTSFQLRYYKILNTLKKLIESKGSE